MTGASRGIGRAIADAFASEGATVAVHYVANEKAARATLAQLSGSGHLVVGADLAAPAQVDDWSTTSCGTWEGSTCS